MLIWQQLRYRFDNYMARGVGAQILLLAAFTTILILVTATAIVAFDVVPTDDQGRTDSFGRLVWKSLMHALDAGAIGGDLGSWTFLFIMLFVTIGGLFVLSALIGVLTQGFGQMIETWRRGRSVVMEKGHTVVLGWTPKLPTLLHELSIANASERKACVVILADRDKVDMDAEVSGVVKGSRLRVVTRSGNPMALDDLRLVSLPHSKAIIVPAHEEHADGSPMPPSESDVIVLKTLLAISKIAPEQRLHLVAELHDERTEAVARTVLGEQAAILRASALVSRLLVQTGRQSGLSIVYSELLGFEGSEIYLKSEPTLAGKSFREAVFAFDTSTLLGVMTGDGQMLLPPPFERRFEASDQIVVISEDDSTILLDGKGGYDDPEIPPPTPRVAEPDRTLVLGAPSRLASVLVELDTYVPPSSTTLVVGEAAAALADLRLRNMQVETRLGDITDRTLLESLDPTSFAHILVLSEGAGRTQEMADARTTVTLLHLRDIARRKHVKIPITTEILDIQNRDIAAVAEADDFIVSNTLVSLMVSQVAENPHLMRVYDELFSSQGHELYLKPAVDYVKPGTVKFGAICEAALRRNEIAIGYRRASFARDPTSAFGVVLNESKQRSIEIAAGDKIVVLAEG